MSDARDGAWYARVLLSARCKPTEAQFDKFAESLKSIPRPFLDVLVDQGIYAYIMRPNQMYGDASPEVRAAAGIADIPAAGLFVVRERTAYLAELGRMCVVHELGGHGVDVALGGVNFFSVRDPIILASLARGESMNVYMASAPDEYWAESVRAYTDTPNEGIFRAAWQPTSRERFESVSPRMAAYITEIEAALAQQLGRGQGIDAARVLETARGATASQDVTLERALEVEVIPEDVEADIDMRRPGARDAELGEDEREIQTSELGR